MSTDTPKRTTTPTATRAYPPLLAASLVLLTALALALLPSLVSRNAPHSDAPVSIPRDFAKYSHLTGSVSSSPPGRAIALFQFGSGGDFLDLHQAIVVGGQRDTYRRVDLAEKRGSAEPFGDPAPMLLSPDGLRVIVGDTDTRKSDLAAVDLRTGGTTKWRVGRGRGVLPLAWSPDSRYVAYSITDTPARLRSDIPPPAGKLGILDMRTGNSRLITGGDRVSVAAFSPDGRELAAQDSGKIRVIDLNGATHRTLTPPAGFWLDGPNAWSPDGKLLATSATPIECESKPTREEVAICHEKRWDIVWKVAFLDATGHSTTQKWAWGWTSWGPKILGWTDADHVVMSLHEPDDSEDPTHELHEIGVSAQPEMSVHGQPSRRLATVVAWSDPYEPSNIQLASVYVGNLQTRPAGAPDRGFWPLWLRLAVAFLVSVPTTVVAVIVSARIQSRRRTRRTS